MKLYLQSFCFGVALGVLPLAGIAQSAPQQERIDASFLLARGCRPSATELEAWNAPETLPVDALLARHREQLQSDAAAQRAVAVRAWRDAFGSDPAPDALAQPETARGTYTELVQRHLQWLVAHPEAYRQVVDRAYRLAVWRAAYESEQEYWRVRAPLSYALLVGCIDNWARRNAPGLTATSGTPSISLGCRYLATERLSPAVAAEVRAATGLVPAGDPALAQACARDILAPGAGELVSVGGIHFAAAGGESLALGE